MTKKSGERIEIMEQKQGRLIIDGNSFYELDLDCVNRKRKRKERMEELKQQRKEQKKRK